MIVNRFGQIILTLLLMTLGLYAALALMPGDPIRALFGFRRPDPEIYQALQEQFRFDEPWLKQWALYVRDLLTGNWGHSFPGGVRSQVRLGPKVSDLIRSTGPISLRILLPALVLQAAAGTVAGAFMASRKGTRSAGLVYLISVLALGIPVLALAYLLQSVIGWQLGWVPTSGVRRGLISYVLPIVSLSLTASALIALLTRSQMQEILTQPFIRSARARSIPARRVIGLHALRVSVMPTITFMAANLGQLITGLIIVEGIFSIPGLGGTVFSAIQRGDRVLVITMIVLITAAISLATLVADVVYTLLDPRLRDK
jgi:ABC-type dipeptide/oligopeptide/nickel transport system permease component